MGCQEEFEKALDLDPDDWECRLVYADWLAENDQPLREAAQRYMAKHRKRPVRIRMVNRPRTVYWIWGLEYSYMSAALISTYRACLLSFQVNSRGKQNSTYWTYFSSRRAAENAMARALDRYQPITWTIP